MCKFLSVISNGKGKVAFFKIDEVAKLMAEGNPKSYDWNSHTSVAHFIGLTAKQEDKWNKWEYNVESKELVVDSLVTLLGDLAALADPAVDLVDPIMFLYLLNKIHDHQL